MNTFNTFDMDEIVFPFCMSVIGKKGLGKSTFAKNLINHLKNKFNLSKFIRYMIVSKN